ncbi:MAG: KpsF/GutQ family sugar-phosphate isomerase [Planctomycetes bacterium]|nr:KpsF/GutQ family sugar-phosphate isomerase [Planctomycetota bacterium]
MSFDPERALSRGLEVLRLEATALSDLRDSLGDAFIDACERIMQCQGRVVVSGMGKAGIIGQKISATLASTGTPSLFLHPAEALHGDLGRLRPEDLLLALSHSGSTRELVQMVPAAQSLGVGVLVICGQPESPLAQHADLVLALGDTPEACPLGLAPTVSTTRMLAMGDALAMAVLEGRDFTREEFAAFHPAGSLGKSLMRIGEMMRTGDELPPLPSTATVADALAVMTETIGRPGAAIVHDDDTQLLGIFTDGDLRRLAQAGQLVLSEPISKHMAAKPRFLRESQLVGEALHLFKETHVDQMPVLASDGDRVVGLVDIQDLLEVNI